MSYITLLPGIICFLVLLRGGLRSAFLNVFLPVLLLLPTNFFLQITHLPDLNFLDITLLVMGAWMLVMEMPGWKYTAVDLVVLVFIFTCGYSEYTIYGGWRVLALAVIEGLFTYMAVKLLLGDPQMRTAAMRRFVILVSLASVIGAAEYFLKINPYRLFFGRFYPDQWIGEATQVRWGFGRMAGPYYQSEFAGMIILTALLLSVWEARWRSSPNRLKLPTLPAAAVKYPRLLLLTLAASLFMTQARGPWIGSMIGILVAWVGLARQPARRGVFLLAAVAIASVPVYQFTVDYTSGKRTDYGSERETAQYRAQLLSNYIPVAQEGGLWGYGRQFAAVGGQDSIDNEYLFVWIVQGSVGAGAFVILVITAIKSFLWLGLRGPTTRERHLGFTLLGILLGLGFTVSTVWLGAQSFEIFFFLLGLSQVIRPEPQALALPRLTGLPTGPVIRVYT
jgi:hypothetical protein